MATIDNGVNVQALLEAREALAGRARGRPVHVAGVIQVGERRPQHDEDPELLRPRRRAEPQDRSRLRRRPPGDLRRTGQRDHADRVPPRRAGELPDGGRGVGRAEPRDPAALGRVDGRGQPRHPRDPRRRQRRPQRLQRHQGDVRRSTPTPPGRRSRRWSPSPRSAPPCSTPSRTRRRSPSRSPEGLTIERFTAVVIGAGHAGLAASHFLSERSIDHVVLERGELANSWRHERWDSLRLLTPNWQSRLPGFDYDGPDPDGYMTSADVVELIERFAVHARAPVRTNTNVTSVRRADDGLPGHDERRRDRVAHGGDRERGLQPADDAGLRGAACRRTSSS